MLTPQKLTISCLVCRAFWLYLVAALFSLIGLIVSAATAGGSRDSIKDQLAKQGQTVSDSTVDALITGTVVVAVVIGILYLAAFVLFAFFMRRGAGWARIVLTILTVISLASITSGYGLGAVRVIAAVIATILIFLAPANEYFRSVKASKAV
jgi:K+-sensing histidine kinase KdpD